MQLFRPFSITWGLLLLSCFGSVSALANNSKFDLGPSLKLSPQFCITSIDDNICEIEITLEWDESLDQPICIMSDHEQLPKWCADSADIHSLTISIEASKDVQFIMTDKVSNQTLAGVKLKVSPATEKQVRRRYRNPWSLF
ncbi:DUF3019 domain-containing protein [Shewanella waksmanii]|uniref:DUF3019 domain-containing protein n=1 Tax=Shewanella waksmanii TaxID=213783 RepID=UPI003735532C